MNDEEQGTAFAFDKFVNDIVEREESTRERARRRIDESNEDAWGRRRDRRYRDHAQNKIRYHR